MSNTPASSQSKRSVRQWLDGALFEPRSKAQWIVYWLVVALILSSVIELAIVAQYPEAATEHMGALRIFHFGLVVFFTIEILLRVFTRPAPRAYLFTWQGAIDLVAVVPGLLSLFVPTVTIDSAWIRSLRLLRLVRSSSLLKHVKKAKNEHLEVLARLSPFFAGGIALKAALLYLEGLGLWPRIHGIDTMITVIGFAIGILLSTRLATVHTRIYGFDQQMELLTGSVEAARPHVNDERNVLSWLDTIYRIIASGGEKTGLDEANDELRKKEGKSIPAPIFNSMHQCAQFLVHRVQTRTPRVYTRLLTRLTVIYTIMVIVAIPGLTGLISSLLVIYVLGGMTLIVEFMDKPFDPHEDSLINSDISGLERYLKHNGLSNK
ncbi:hypothetical protein J2T60_002588 [Natronospira proteinivora]|uniref:Ion transport domain-containing protein n=1 Tax=Natronospira proteinivora TaxID=1807133 RepID=A0ABT1GB96_9GAMM|nr:ion transporter [Natronospira proteinivora]MCP1728574.1 hypothetical protein [Natronospira proteinivora]